MATLGLIYPDEYNYRLLYPNPTSMGNTNSVRATSNRPLPKIKFRVLIIGRANAGKTSILQRVCDTTDSVVVHRGNEEVRGLTFVICPSVLTPPRFDLTRPRMLVSLVLRSAVPDPRGSVASTTSRMNSCFPITTDTFFTIPADSRLVATRN